MYIRFKIYNPIPLTLGDLPDHDTQTSERSFGSALASIVSPPSEVVKTSVPVSTGIRSTKEYPEYIITPTAVASNNINHEQSSDHVDNKSKFKV